MAEYKTIEDVKAANGAAGQFFFEPHSMRFWGARVSSRIHPVANGAYFVTSETDIEGNDRRYSVRFINESGKISTVGEFLQHATLRQAHAVAKGLADATGRDGYSDYGTIWVCVCCMLSHANGECCDSDEHGGDGVQPWAKLEDNERVAMGLSYDEHGTSCTMHPDHPEWDRDTECDCETDTYSTSQCDGCGSYLHGERHAFHLLVKRV